MKYLIEAAREYGLDEIASQALENYNVHGIIVDIDPTWLAHYSRHLRFQFDELDFEYNFFERRRRNWQNLLKPGEDMGYFPTCVPINLRWYPRNWRRYFGELNNLRIRIQLRPGSKSIEIANFSSRLSIIQEHTPVLQFSSLSKSRSQPLEGGVSIGQGIDSPGTLGGILIDKNTGKSYGLTCGHVIKTNQTTVDQPAKNDNKLSNVVGKCVYRTDLQPKVNKFCNPRNPSDLNQMDLALIELDESILASQSILNIGNIKTFIPSNQLHPNLIVEFNGRTSDHRTLVLGGIGLVQEVEDAATGNKYCYKDLIEIKQPSLWDLLRRRPVKGGDSGAWVVCNGQSGLEWCGMIIGENRQAGYAIASEDIIHHLNSNTQFAVNF